MTSPQEKECCKECYLRVERQIDGTWFICTDASCKCHSKSQESWSEKFDENICNWLNDNAPFTDIKAFISNLLEEEREKAYTHGHCDGHDEGLTDGLQGIEEKVKAGQRAAYTAVWEKVWGVTVMTVTGIREFNSWLLSEIEKLEE